MREASKVLCGDAGEVLRALPSRAVHCVVTSPPYWGLRDYGMEGQIGLEATVEGFVGRLVEVFREVRRVLRDDGTVWLNLGDTYAGSGNGRNADGSSAPGGVKQRGNRGTVSGRLFRMQDGRPKNLLGVPWRVAFALQADGWFLRQDIVWHKRNPMPESVRDRCTRSHEYLFLLSKRERYFFDAEAIKEPTVTCDDRSRDRETSKLNNCPGRRRMQGLTRNNYEVRNKRSVWTLSSRPYKGAHFATFPPDLVRPCVLAGAPMGGVVLDPFAGSGTTGAVALEHGRKAWLIELNPDYVRLIEERLQGVGK